MSVESSGKPDAWKLARPVWGWGRGAILRPTPLVYGSLAVTGLLFASETWRWFSFNEHKGYAVLTCVASVGAAFVLLLLWFLVALLFRLRFQFGIRTLLVLVVAAALPCSWLAVEMKRAREQEAAVAAIKEAHGSVWYEFELDSRGDLVTNPQPQGPSWLRRRLGGHFFQSAVSAYVQDDTAMMCLNRLPRLRELYLVSRLPPAPCPVGPPTDYKKLVESSGTTTLDKAIASASQSIEEPGTQLGKPKLDHSRLKKFLNASMKEFICPVNGGGLYTGHESYASRGVSDAALANLAALRQLRVLCLAGSNITDGVLEHIQGLTELRELYLIDANVTDAGVWNLHQALSNCKIDH